MEKVKRSFAPKLQPPEDPVALVEGWKHFHQRVMAEFRPAGRILFIPSCSGDKPYERSRSHTTYRELLDRVAPNQVDKVTLSGILGPVPQAMEGLVANEYNYNFYLNRYAHLKGQLPDLTARLVEYMSEFLHRFGGYYDTRVSFSRENYRKVMQLSAGQCEQHRVIVLPAHASTSLAVGMSELEDVLSR